MDATTLRLLEDTTSDLWVFAYGSLMWRPGFPYQEWRPALLRGYHRALCVYSVRYRGTPESPGLVMGLDRGGACRGRAYRVAAAERADVLAYLDAREMVNGVYEARYLPVLLDAGRREMAYGFVARREHVQYAGCLPPERAAEIVRTAVGAEGPARDYLANTVEHLEQMGIRDGALHRLLRLVEADPAPGSPVDGGTRPSFA